MDILTTVGFAITGFIIFLLAIFVVGLKTKVPDTETGFDILSIKYEPWKDDIPLSIIKHYESIYEKTGMPVVKTVFLNGKAKYKISNLWMPVIYHTWVEHGTGFLRELDFYWYGRVILKGVDFWLKGVGALRVNGVIRMNETGANVTESQRISFLAESLLLGTFDFSSELIKWDSVDDRILKLTPISNNGELNSNQTINIDFDAKTGRIKCISTERYRGQLENKRISWSLVVKKWEKKQGMWVPEYQAKWDDQKKPWCYYVINGITINNNSQVVSNAIKKINIGKYRTEILISKHKKDRKHDTQKKLI